MNSKLCRFYPGCFLPLLMAFSSASIADTDQYLSFLYDKGYLKDQYITTENYGYECFKVLLPDLKPDDEAAWRKYSIQEDLQIIPNGTGGAVVGWAESGARVYLQSVDGDGKVLWGPIALNRAITRQDSYRLILDDAGGVLVVWQETAYDCDSQKEGKSNVVVQKFDSKGQRQWGPKGVSIMEGVSSGAPNMVADGKGGAVIIWYQLTSMLAQRVDRTGKKLWASQGVEVSFAPTLPKIEGGPIAPSIDGGVVVVSTGVVFNRDAAAQRISGEGKNLWAPPPRISSGNTYHLSPRMIPDASGGAMIAMTPDRGDGEAVVMRLDAKASVAWRVSLSPGDSQKMAGFVPDGNGGAVVVWGKRSTDGNHFTYFAQRVSANGQVQWKENVMLGSIGTAELASVIADGSGGVIVAWRNLEPLRGKNWPDGKSVLVQDVYVQRVSATGDLPWKTPRLIAANIGKTGSSDSMLALAPDQKNGAIIAWSDARSGFDIAPLKVEEEGPETGDPQVTGHLYAQHVAASGEMAWQDNGIDISSRVSDSSGCLERTSQTAVVAGFGVGLHKQPKASSEIFLSLKRGAEVLVVKRMPTCETQAGRKGRWVQVQVPSAPGKEGWIIDSNLVYPQHAQAW